MRFFACLLAASLASSAAAAPMRVEDVPAPLRPWTNWVLHGQIGTRCPFFTGAARTATCAWPATLDLRVDDAGGESAQQWRVFEEGWVPLVGDAEHWPQDVTVDGSRATVVESSEAPGIVLRPGDHAVRARFAWDALPESLRVPAESGLVRLEVRGDDVSFPLREADRLWIQRAREVAAEEDRLDLRIHRLVTDDVPLRVLTRVELQVSGKDREVLLGRALLPGTIPMALSGGLPARLEADGRLRVQARAGEHVLELTARFEGPVRAIPRADPDGPWADQEVWAFEAVGRFRVVQAEGVAQVDPKQTTLPAPWHSFPAFAVGAGDTLRLVEKRRGDSDPPPDRLALERTLWLDHDGDGLTARDRITGSLRRSFRLEMGAGTDLGRATVHGQDQLITRLRDGGPAGIELRQGTARIESIARISNPASVPAVSWNHDFHSVSAVLHLPAGWRLLAASGADDVPQTWLRRWSLLDLFLVLVIAIATARLWGAAWGVLALLALGLTATESDAPRWAWVAALCGEALARVLPPGRIAALARVARLGAQVAVVLIAVPFVVHHLRGAMYPAVVREAWSVDIDLSLHHRDAAPIAAAKEEPAQALVAEQSLESDVPMMPKSVPATPPPSEPAKYLYRTADVDPAAQVQTGPGLPRWASDAATLHFSGPVERGQRVRLWLAPPWLNLLLALLRIGLIAALIGRLRGRIVPRGGAAAAAALVGILLAPGAAGAQIPSAEMLEELRRRLTEPPACAPSCVSLPRMTLDAAPNALRMRLEAHATARTAIPLPGSDEWPPERVLLDGSPARALLRHEGALWIALEPGRHQIAVEGGLPPRAAVQIRMGLRPRRVETAASGWTVAGVHADGVADDTLVLTRDRDATGAPDGALEPTALPPFVSVDRALHLGLVWTMETTVRRLTPPGAAVVLEVPLLAGESVTTAAVRVESHHVKLHLASEETEKSWQSTLPITTTIALAATRESAWAEVWRLDASAIWHVLPRGIPPVQPAEEAGRRVPEWRPWPGETLALEVTRPAGVAGRTLTIESAAVRHNPGERAVDTTLSLEVRSSRGGEHALTLPDGAALEGVTVDGAPHPIRAHGRTVVLPVVPGERRFEVSWREPRGTSAHFSGSQVGLGAPATNVDVTVAMPAGRWTLLVGGPRQGPAVLFWSLLCGLLLVAWGLSRSSLVSLRFHQWMLLAIGLSQVPIAAAAIVAGWLLALGARRRWPGTGAVRFNLVQVLLLGWTVAALIVLFVAIHQGLLGEPDMQIAGNGSSARELRWFADRTGAELPRPWALSVPLIVYRLAMLAWALWIAQALIGWLRWAWTCFADGGIWRPLGDKTREAK